MKKVVLILSAVMVFVAGCSGRSIVTEQNTTPVNTTKDVAKIQVVTTIAPLYSLSANIVEGVDDVELVNLVPPNTSVHTFALTPEAIKNLYQADLVVINGLELDAFLDEVLGEIDGEVLDTSANVDLIKSVDEHVEGDEYEDEHEDEHEDNHGEYDPHIWLSPMNAKVQAKNIANEMVVLDPENADVYNQNLANLEERLDSLITDAQVEFGGGTFVPYVVFHDAYGYFERDFGMSPVAHIEEFAGQEPSADYLAGVIDLIQENDVKVVFTEPQFSPKLVQTLSSDYDLEVRELDPIGKEVSKDAYFDMMTANLDAFKAIIKQ